MFVAVATRTMANARFKALEPDPFVRRTVEQMRAERRANNRDLLIRHEFEIRNKVRLDELRSIANEAVRAGNDALRAYREETASLDRILLRICRVTKTTPMQILGPGRSRHVSFARAAIAYWARRLSGLSLPQIGRALGNRDHTTILHYRNVYPAKRAKMGRTLRQVP